MEKYPSLAFIGFAAWAITAMSAPPGKTQERPAFRHDVEAWVQSYRRGLPEPPVETKPKTHLPREGRSVRRPPPLPAGFDPGGAPVDNRLPAGTVRHTLQQGGDQ